MNKRKLVLLGILASLTVAGCTQHIARNDSAEPPAAAAASADSAAPAAAAQDAPAAPAAAQTMPLAEAPAAAIPTALPAPMPDAAPTSAPAAAASDTAAKPAAQDAAAPAPAKDAAAPAPDAKETKETAASPATVAKADQDAAAAKQAEVLLPLPPEEVADTIKKLTHHPRVRYLSRTAQYDYYVGGRLDAKYDINNNQLIVTSDGDDNQVKCEYSNDGKMISDGNAAPPKLVGSCNSLINELGTYLSH